MRRSKSLALVAGVAVLSTALGACASDDDGDGENTDRKFGEQGGGTKDPERNGPAPEVEGATKGGTVTVYLPGDPGPDHLDPTEGWSVTGNSIQQALTHRSLTQYARNEDGSTVLVPDLATDLGRPNEDFTEWTFTLREGVKWENGNPITPEEVAFGISRSLDDTAFPGGPGTEYSKHYFADGDTYKGPYTSKKPYEGITVNGRDITIKMSTTFPDMDYWGAFMAMGPIPEGKISDPPDYGKKPLSSGPYKIESFRPTEELVLVKNDQWDPATDPARHQYPDKYIFKFNADPTKTDKMFLENNTDSKTSISTALDSANYSEANSTLGDRLVQQSAQCTSFLYPDYSKTTKNIRLAIAYAYPYEDVWSASGEVPGVTRVPANSVMPPGMAGKKEYYADGAQFEYNPEKAKALLEEEGFGPGEYEINMIYYSADPLAVAGQKQITKGFEAAGFKVNAKPTPESPYNTWTDPENKLNKTLNLRGVNWCSDWPSGLTMLPPLLKTDAVYNTGHFSEKSVDDQMEAIPSMPLEDQAAAWGDLDEKVAKDYFPIIPTAFRNDLFVYGENIGNFHGDGAMGAPYYKDLFVKQ